jgi:hypothetical protein
MNVLNGCRHKECAIIHENFYLGRVLRPGVRHKLKRMGSLADDDNLARLVDAMYENKFHGVYWRKLAQGRAGIDKQTMFHRLQRTDRSDKAIYETILRSCCQEAKEAPQSVVLGDKNGPNLYRVPTLLEWFPDAKVVHTLRDPRAVLASQLRRRDRFLRTAKRPKPSRLLVRLLDPALYAVALIYIPIAWLRAARLHYEYTRRYPENYYGSRFEDLVGNPVEHIRNLCTFLDLPFDAGMLNPPKVDSSYAGHRERGIDEHAIARWQRELKPWMNAWLLFWLEPRLRQLGYLAE